MAISCRATPSPPGVVRWARRSRAGNDTTLSACGLVTPGGRAGARHQPIHEGGLEAPWSTTGGGLEAPPRSSGEGGLICWPPDGEMDEAARPRGEGESYAGEGVSPTGRSPRGGLALSPGGAALLSLRGGGPRGPTTSLVNTARKMSLATPWWASSGPPGRARWPDRPCHTRPTLVRGLPAWARSPQASSLGPTRGMTPPHGGSLAQSTRTRVGSPRTRVGYPRTGGWHPTYGWLASPRTGFPSPRTERPRVGPVLG